MGDSDLLGVSDDFNEEISSRFNDYTALGQTLFEFAEGIAFPSVAHFKNGEEGNITYIAARHARGIEHPTCKAIFKEFERQTPDCVILEGVTRDAYDEMQDWLSQSDPKNIGEPPYLFQLVEEENFKREDNKIKVFGGEPTSKCIEEKILKLGYNKLDIYFCDFISYIHEKFKLREIPSIEKCLELYSGEKDEKASTLFKEFKEWCVKHHYEIDLMKAKKGETAAPIKDGDFVQKLTYNISNIRNIQIFNTLKECSEKYNNILIVYGASHYYQQYPVLVGEFGIPTYEPQSIFSRAQIYIKNIIKYFS